MDTPIYLSSDLRAREAAALADLPPGTLMRRAGAAAAARNAQLLGRLPDPSPGKSMVLVLCGPGNNGGDGLECARALRQQGIHAQVWCSAWPQGGDALHALNRWRSSVKDDPSELTQLPAPESVRLVVDALFGIGIRRGLDLRARDALQWAQQHQRPIVALDLPSGLHPDTGRWVDAVPGAQCLATVSFLGAKPGLYMAEGKDAAGEILLEDLDIHHLPPQSRARLNSAALFPSVTRARPHHSHKGSYGEVAVLGGAPGMVGAAVLAARAALRMGAGKVFLTALGAPDLLLDPLMPEIMLRSAPPPMPHGVLVAGCGLGTDSAAQAALNKAMSAGTPAVLDADALNLLSAHASWLAGLRGPGDAPVVLTPHPAEAARLLQSRVDAVQADRIAAARHLAGQHQAIVVLKGAGTVIARPSSAAPIDLVINPNGNAWLGSAGTGDVLAGMIGSLMAQGLASLDPHEAAWQAALAGVWWHAEAGDRLGPGLVASELAGAAATARAQAIRLQGPGWAAGV